MKQELIFCWKRLTPLFCSFSTFLFLPFLQGTSSSVFGRVPHSSQFLVKYFYGIVRTSTTKWHATNWPVPRRIQVSVCACCWGFQQKAGARFKVGPEDEICKLFPLECQELRTSKDLWISKHCSRHQDGAAMHSLSSPTFSDSCSVTDTMPGTGPWEVKGKQDRWGAWTSCIQWWRQLVRHLHRW